MRSDHVDNHKKTYQILPRGVLLLQENPQEASSMLTMGQLSEVTGVAYHTLNYYVKEGLIWPITRMGPYRMFHSNIIKRIKRIRELREASEDYPKGMPIRRIKAIIDQDSDSR